MRFCQNIPAKQPRSASAAYFGLSVGCGLLLALSSIRATYAQVTWLNPSQGLSAGSWFDGANWSTAIVPNATQVAIVANGGEAKVSNGAASVSRLEIGKDAGAGVLTVAGGSVSVAIDFDIGEIGGTFANGPISVNSNGSVSIADATSVTVGVSGV
jgi:hypothetical protein